MILEGFYSVKDCILLADERAGFDRKDMSAQLKLPRLINYLKKNHNREPIMGSMFEGGVEIPSGSGKELFPEQL